jgi:Secretion system C-terminal sorting domain
MKFKLLLLFLLIQNFIFAQDIKPFYLGHSLVNFDMPAMVHGLALNAGKTTNYNQQIINGSPLQYNYNNHASAQGTSYRIAFPNGGFNTLVATEAIPLQNHLTYSNTHKYADSLFKYAKNNNNNIPIKYYIYETWHCTTTGTPTGCSYDNNDDLLWQQRLQADLPLWTGIVNYVKNQFPTDNIWLVPAGQAMYKLNTRIIAGTLPGITNFTDLFYDDIHLTNKGNYFVACVMYATLFRESPVGLSTALNNNFSTPFANMPTPQQALIMQQVAWETVTELSNLTGVSTLSANDFKKENTFKVFPNPVSDELFINHDVSEDINYEVLDSKGKTLLKGSLTNSKSINLSTIQGGFYFLKISSENYQNIQKIIKI